MSKKKDNDKIDEQVDLDPVEVDSKETEPALSEHEADALDESRVEAEAVQPEEFDNEAESEMSPDDLLEDVRHSLIADSNEKEEVEQSKWWRRILKRGGKKKDADPQPEAMDSRVESPVAEVVAKDNGQSEYVEQLDELIDMLEEDEGEDVVAEDAPAPEMVETVPEKAHKTEEVIDLGELKRRAFSARATPEEEERSLSEVRSVALDEGGEEVFVEVEAKTVDPMQDRMKAFENALKPYRRYFNFVFVFISVVMILVVSASLYRVYLRSLPPPPAEAAIDMPYPVGMNLPGGLGFNIKRGKLVEGRWDPRGPEWLEGTEICRWIAIPYSRQLEAVVRTLTREDQIELVMSNNDRLAYTVDSIDQLSLDEMQELDSGSPCMMLVLAQVDTDKRWVVTALP